MEARLAQQQDVLRQEAYRSDPRIPALERKLKEQGQLLSQALNDPDARFSVLESRLEELQDDLFDLPSEPNARLDALENRLREQQFLGNDSDPRFAALEAKMRMQEEQIREATAAISDARITSLRTKLIEQQELLEGAVRQGNTKNPVSLGNTIDAIDESGETKKGWGPFGGWNSGWNNVPPKPARKEMNENPGAGFPPVPPPPPMADSPPVGPYQNPPREASSDAPQQVFTYQSPAPQDDPVGSRRVGKNMNPSPRNPISDFRAFQPPPATPTSQPLQSTRKGNAANTRGGGFRGNPFGRAGGVTIETEDDQKPVDVGIPRKSIAESAKPGRRDRRTPPTPVNNKARPFSDQDQWRQDALDPDSTWDRDAPNPDAVRRPPLEPQSMRTDPPSRRVNHGVPSNESTWDRNYVPANGFATTSKGAVSGGVTSDQGRLNSVTPIARDIDDMRSARPPASYTRSHQQPPPSQKPYQSKSGGEEDLFMKDYVMSEYMEWCISYEQEPSEYRFQNFYRNYAEMGATRQFPVRWEAGSATWSQGKRQ
jgi:hypothetical protein